MLNSLATELIGAFLVGVIVSSWNHFIVPLFVEVFGEKVKLKKLWKGSLKFNSESTDIHEVTIEVKKLGNKISGQLQFTSGKHVGKKYDMTGRYQNDILTFYYTPLDNHSTSQGTATFERKLDGNLLEGYFIYYSQDNAIIDTVPCQLNPIKH